MRPDDTGSYTDSNEYSDIVSECTNLSVGYMAQHTKNESQDLQFAVDLRAKLIEADWSKLVIERDPSVIEYSYSGGYSYTYGSHWTNVDYDDPMGQFRSSVDITPYEELVRENPEAVARLLSDYFQSHLELYEELYDYGMQDKPSSALNRWPW